MVIKVNDFIYADKLNAIVKFNVRNIVNCFFFCVFKIYSFLKRMCNCLSRNMTNEKLLRKNGQLWFNFFKKKSISLLLCFVRIGILKIICVHFVLLNFFFLFVTWSSDPPLFLVLNLNLSQKPSSYLLNGYCNWPFRAF